MSLRTPSQSVSHKQFHHCVNHKKKLSLRHPLPTFGISSFCQAFLWLGVDKVLQKLTKSYKGELWHLLQCCILIPRKCPHKTTFQHAVREGAPAIFENFTYLWGAPPAAVTAVASATMLAFNAFKDCFLDVADEPEVDEEAVTEANVDTATAAPEPEPPEVVLIEGVVDKLWEHSYII